MKLYGLQKMTLLDFPGHVACTVFTGGCNLRCPFCHNALLVTQLDDSSVIYDDEFFAFLQKRKGLLDGVCITGGEPLMQPDIEEFIIKIKQLGFKVKLDTNGCFLEKLKSLIEKDLLDAVAVDIKNSKEKYALTVGINNFDVLPIEQTVDFLLSQNKVDFEFRTTVCSPLHEIEDVEKIALWIKGTKHYYLQNFVDSGNLIGENITSLDKETLNKMLEKAQKIIPSAELRGV